MTIDEIMRAAPVIPVLVLDGEGDWARLAETFVEAGLPVYRDALPCLRLAREAAIAGGTAPCVLNAANEIAVHAFLEGRLPFLGIAAVIEETLGALGSKPIRAFETLYEADHEARDMDAEFVEERVA